MTDNNFGKASLLNISTIEKNGRTVITDEYFTAPFKIMKPFQKDDGSINVMILTVSAGLMEGDRQEITLNVGEGSSVSITSQSFEKIHKMEDGYASRNTNIVMGENSFLHYSPLPVIPFAESNYRAITNISLKKTSQLILSEVISCGRYCCDERFLYKNFSSFTEVRREKRLIYRDNSVFRPAESDMGKDGFYEGSTHLLSLTAFGFKEYSKIKDKLNNMIDELKLDAGVSLTFDKDLVFRVLGNSGDELYHISQRVAQLIRG
ncbi:MAG TPA: urease accessory protein UreH [Lachnospiraceae bacterium]|nr:urease accessory protein UreH [Lachnospiraceae bacterium]